MEVNCFTQWGKLNEIIVGTVENNCIPFIDPSVKACYTSDQLKEAPSGKRSDSSIKAAEQEIDNFIQVLQSYNVTVHRPSVIDWTKGIKTPFWQTTSQVGTSCPRDIISVIGQDIIESGMSWRSRYFEYVAYRDIIFQKLEDDPQAEWTAAPQPILAEPAYRNDYPDEDAPQREEMVQKELFVTTENDIIFQAADIMRCGQDVFYQYGFTSNKRAFQWLQQHLSYKGFRAHLLTFPDDTCPIHMDATFFPIKAPDSQRKGIIYNCPDRRLPSQYQYIMKPSFDIVDAPDADNEAHQSSMCTQWLSMNFLHINPTTIVIEETEQTTQKALQSLGIQAIPIPFRNCYEMGGSLHCYTSDLNREDSMVNYLPHLDQ